MSDWEFFDTDNEFQKMTTPEETILEESMHSGVADAAAPSPASFSPAPAPPAASDASQAPSFSSSQATDLIRNTSALRAPLQPIQENKDSSAKIIGINLCVSNKMLDIHDYLLYFMDTIHADTVYDYKQRPTSAISKEQLIHLLGNPNEAVKLYTNFFGIQDDIPRDKQGNKLQGRRYAGFYVSSSQTYREMKQALWKRLGQREQMLKLGWYLNPYEDKETVQKIVAIILGKHPSKGYPRGYADRIKACLKRHSPDNDFQLTIVSHNDRTSSGDKIQAYGIQIGRDQASDLIKAMKAYPSKHFDGIYVKYKSEKKDFEAYDKALDNISQIPDTYTGIPVINLDMKGAHKLREELSQAPLDNLPVDVEATHLHQKFGKYMVICPVLHVDTYRSKLSSILQAESYKNDSFPDPPELQTRQFKRKSPSPTPSISDDPFGNLSVLAENITVRTAPTYRELRQQALNNLPQIGPTRRNLFAEIPTEINMAPPSYLAAAGTDEASIGDSTLASKISQLTDENSRLQQSIQSRDETILSLQQQLDDHVATSTQTAKELQDTRKQMTTLQDNLRQVKEEHSSEMERLLESHRRDVKIMQDNHKVQMQEQAERSAEERRKEVKALQEQADLRHQESMKYFEDKFKAWTTQLPIPPPTPQSNKRSRTNTGNTTTDEAPSSDATMSELPSQAMQDLTLTPNHENQESQES